MNATIAGNNVKGQLLGTAVLLDANDTSAIWVVSAVDDAGSDNVYTKLVQVSISMSNGGAYACASKAGYSSITNGNTLNPVYVTSLWIASSPSNVAASIRDVGYGVEQVTFTRGENALCLYHFLSVCMSVGQSDCLDCRIVSLSVCLFVGRSVCLSAHLPICLHTCEPLPCLWSPPTWAVSILFAIRVRGMTTPRL